TLMYGSSLRMETERPRLLSGRPMLAAVMPLPSDDVTPPVTKTYFATGLVLRGFFRCYRNGAVGANAGRPPDRPRCGAQATHPGRIHPAGSDVRAPYARDARAAPR